MLFRKQTLTGIRDGKITLAFRRWKRPTVREGGTLLTPVGQLQIGTISTVAIGKISLADAQSAGYETRAALLDELNRRKEGRVYRIELGSLKTDPRIKLRSAVASEAETEELRKKLARLDARSTGSAWTTDVLRLIRQKPATRAGDLCSLINQQRDDFKRNVRKLKNLGLTKSLEVGYRLSPRGEALLDVLEADSSR